MILRSILSTIFWAFLLSACVSSSSDEVLSSAVEPQSAPAPAIEPVVVKPEPADQSAIAFASQRPVLATQPVEEVEPVIRPRTRKTYLINGLASSVESIGYGFTNLSRKIPGSTLHNYASFIESSTVIRAKVTRELKAAHAADPNIEINLIGISFGANIVTLIASDLDRRNIPVNYLVTMEGPAMVPIRDNVRVADNFSCTNLDCFRTKSKLAWGNKTTKYSTFKIRSSHIPLANHSVVHSRILSQIEAPTQPLLVGQ